MNELERLLVGAAAVGAVIYFVGPSAMWRITKSLAACLLIILVLIWALTGLTVPC
jgi:membrane protein YdbS with pleckstrin-like domain